MVHVLLVTGSDAALTRWHDLVCLYLLCQEKRGQTAAYTCMDDDFDFAKKVAADLPVTLQEVCGSGDSESYPVLVRNCDCGWKLGKEAKRWEDD